MLSVLIVSQDSRFLDCVGNALHGEGMSAATTAIAEKGLRPQAIVVDPAVLLEPHGAELVRYLGGSPTVPVFSISSVAKRIELAGLLSTLRRLDEGDERACG